MLKKPKYFNQCLVLASRIGSGWTAPTIPLFSKPETCPFDHCHPNLVPLIASMGVLASILGPFITGSLINTIGRKPCLLIGSVINITSWLVLSYARNMTMVVFYRILNGTGASLILSTYYVYFAEISSLSIRGVIQTTCFLTSGVGVLVMYIMGAFLPYSVIPRVALFISILHIIFTPLIPETPTFLVMKGDISKATNTIKWLRQTDDEKQISEEIKLIETSLSHTPKSSVSELFISKTNRKPFSILMIIRTFEGFNGMTFIAIFVTTIFESLNNSMSAPIQTIYLGIFSLVPSILVPFIIDRFGRRKLIIIGYATLSMIMLSLAIFFYLNAYQIIDPEKYKLVPLVLLISAYQAVGIAGPVIVIIGSELLQDKVRGLGITIIISFKYLLAFIVAFVLGYLRNIIGNYILFSIFAFNCACLAIFSYMRLPETMGKNSKEVMKMFVKK